ncbi:MAG: mechanosensitive ion channel [Verrucomicrobia bacterium]|nr:mechanosensitive ion channel [Verrucomicrobiota bacterium]
MISLESVHAAFQELPLWQRIVGFGGVVFVTYLILLVTGRALKRRLHLQLGLSYQVAAASLGLYGAIVLLAPALPGRRESAALAILCGVHALLPVVTFGLLPWFFETKRHQPMPRFLREVVSLLAFVTTVLLVLQIDYDVQVPGLIAGSGIVAIAIGFAAQNVLGNILSGITLYISRPFHVHDWVLIEHQHVQVVEINWRSTRFRTLDNIVLDVPNSKITSETITNFSGHERHGHQLSRPHALRIEVGVDYAAPPNRVREVLRAAAAAVEDVLAKPEPDVFLKNFGDSAVLYEVRYWIINHHRHLQIADGVRTNIWYALRRAEIGIPFPIRTVQLAPRPRTDGRRHGARHEELRARLQSQPVFQVLDTEHLDHLLEKCPTRTFGRGERIIVEQAPGDSMFVLVSGVASVLVRGAGGESSEVARLRAGDCFGEMSLLTGEPRSATVQASEDCEVLEITKKVFASLLSREESLVQRLSDLLARRRLETEGHAQRTVNGHAPVDPARHSSYQENFLTRLRAFFEL